MKTIVKTLVAILSLGATALASDQYSTVILQDQHSNTTTMFVSVPETRTSVALFAHQHGISSEQMGTSAYGTEVQPGTAVFRSR